jgi:hypothetical protein
MMIAIILLFCVIALIKIVAVLMWKGGYFDRMINFIHTLKRVYGVVLGLIDKIDKNREELVDYVNTTKDNAHGTALAMYTKITTLDFLSIDNMLDVAQGYLEAELGVNPIALPLFKLAVKILQVNASRWRKLRTIITLSNKKWEYLSKETLIGLLQYGAGLFDGKKEIEAKVVEQLKTHGIVYDVDGPTLSYETLIASSAKSGLGNKQEPHYEPELSTLCGAIGAALYWIIEKCPRSTLLKNGDIRPVRERYQVTFVLGDNDHADVVTDIGEQARALAEKYDFGISLTEECILEHADPRTIYTDLKGEDLDRALEEFFSIENASEWNTLFITVDELGIFYYDMQPWVNFFSSDDHAGESSRKDYVVASNGARITPRFIASTMRDSTDHAKPNVNKPRKRFAELSRRRKGGFHQNKKTGKWIFYDSHGRPVQEYDELPPNHRQMERKWKEDDMDMEEAEYDFEDPDDWYDRIRINRRKRNKFFDAFKDHAEVTEVERKPEEEVVIPEAKGETKSQKRRKRAKEKKRKKKEALEHAVLMDNNELGPESKVQPLKNVCVDVQATSEKGVTLKARGSLARYDSKNGVLTVEHVMTKHLAQGDSRTVDGVQLSLTKSSLVVKGDRKKTQIMRLKCGCKGTHCKEPDVIHILDSRFDTEARLPIESYDPTRRLIGCWGGNTFTCDNHFKPLKNQKLMCDSLVYANLSTTIDHGSSGTPVFQAYNGQLKLVGLILGVEPNYQGKSWTRVRLISPLNQIALPAYTGSGGSIRDISPANCNQTVAARSQSEKPLSEPIIDGTKGTQNQ